MFLPWPAVLIIDSSKFKNQKYFVITGIHLSSFLLDKGKKFEFLTDFEQKKTQIFDQFRHVLAGKN